jgi:hypothetical protein
MNKRTVFGKLKVKDTMLEECSTLMLCVSGSDFVYGYTANANFISDFVPELQVFQIPAICLVDHVIE